MMMMLVPNINYNLLPFRVLFLPSRLFCLGPFVEIKWKVGKNDETCIETGSERDERESKLTIIMFMFILMHSSTSFIPLPILYLALIIVVLFTNQHTTKHKLLATTQYVNHHRIWIIIMEMNLRMNRLKILQPVPIYPLHACKISMDPI